MEAPSSLQVVVGMSEESATEILRDEGWNVRVIARDSQYYIVTRDYKLDRVNLEIMDGKISKIDVG